MTLEQAAPHSGSPAQTSAAPWPRAVITARAPAVLVLAWVCLGGLGAAACGTPAAHSLAVHACGHVRRAVALYEKALADPPASQLADVAASENELHLALPEAADAAGQDAQFQGLVTALSEGSRVPENLLLPALERQCQAVQANSPYG